MFKYEQAVEDGTGIEDQFSATVAAYTVKYRFTGHCGIK